MTEPRDPRSWLGESLREELEEELEARDFETFHGQVMQKIEAEVERTLSEPFALAEPLRSETEDELDSRRLHWSAFTRGVLREIGREERAEARQSLAERATAELVRDVETELERVEPQFERRFGREVLRRIDTTQPSLLERFRAFWSNQVDGWRTGVGLIGAATAVFLLIIAAPRLESPPEQIQPRGEDRGSMVVREVSFDGRVMVIEGEGVTFVYLSDT